MINAKPSRNGTLNERWSASTIAGNDVSANYAIQSINLLPTEQKRAVYLRLIPPELFRRFRLDARQLIQDDSELLVLNCPPGSTMTEMALYHQSDFPDPVLYGQIADTINGQVHVLLYILNDPESPRFDVDRLEDGTPTKFGTQCRNLEAEAAAMQNGLAPGQVRRGLRLLGSAIQAFECFVASLGHELYFTEPLYYHNAILFERHGFSYQQGRKLMQRIQEGFTPGGDLISLLDSSTPFRSPAAVNSVRLRSWAIHDNLLGEPFTDVTMYKHIGKSAGLDTSSGCAW
jgi:acetoin utilization protein AcuC